MMSFHTINKTKIAGGFILSALLIGFAFFSFITPVHAQGWDSQTFLDSAFTPEGELQPALAGELAFATTQFHTLPASVQTLFGDQRMAINLVLNGGVTEKLGIVTANKEIVSITRYHPANPTMNVFSDEETLAAVASSNDPATAFVAAVNEGKITYEGISGNGVLTAFVADVVVVITNIIKAFSGILGI